MSKTESGVPKGRTKIVATLGPTTDRRGVLDGMLRAGLDVVRLNLSHGHADDHRRRVAEVREASAALGVEVGILTDLQGPKIRIGRFADGPISLADGDDFCLDCRPDAAPGDQHRVGVSHAGLCADVAPGDELLLDDGLVSMTVTTVAAPLVHCRVDNGGKLSDHKGLNRRGGGLSVDALSTKDREDIRLSAELAVDFMAVSFVRSAADVQAARSLLREAGSGAAVIAKIERAEALDNLADIIRASDGVMVARGDLGVEIGYAELPGLQKRIIRESLQHNRPVITATQMLQSMISSPIPTRAEVLDVANAVIDGTDAVMLSQETAAGAHPDKAVRAMCRICLAAERQFVPADRPSVAPHQLVRTDQAIALAAMSLAAQVPVRAIIALTESGNTARWLSHYRSAVPIYALSQHAAARRRMALLHDVHAVPFDVSVVQPARVARAAVQHLFARGCVAVGDRVLLTHGDHTGEHGGTNTLKLLHVGEDGIPVGLSDL